MEEKDSPFGEAERKSSHRTKKRKHTDLEQRPPSRKRKKHLDGSLENAPDTPIPSSKSRTKAPPPNEVLQSPPSSQPVSAALPESDHDISITDTPATTNGSTAELPSPFYTTTMSLYLPLPAIALSPITALPSLLTARLTPLLLTYYPPVRGIILSISNPILSSKKPQPNDPPTDPNERTVVAHCADTDGLSYVWLTATFLLFKPQIGDELEGWVNVCSEGFVGLICYNYFQVAIAKNRIPTEWRWIPPGGEVNAAVKWKTRRKTKTKRKRNDDDDEIATATSQERLVNGDDVARTEEEEEEEEEGKESGYFQRDDGTKVKGSIRFRVVDCEIVPGHDRESWSLQIEGTLLSTAEERRVLEEEQLKALRRQGKAVMSGGLSSVGRNESLSHSIPT